MHERAIKDSFLLSMNFFAYIGIGIFYNSVYHIGFVWTEFFSFVIWPLYLFGYLIGSIVMILIMVYMYLTVDTFLNYKRLRLD